MLSARILSAIVFFVLFFLGLFHPAFFWVLPFLLGMACLMSLHEFMHFGLKHPPYVFQSLAYATAVILLADAYFFKLHHGLMTLGVLTVVSLAVGTLRTEPNFTDVTGKCLIGTLYATLPLAMIMMMWRDVVQKDPSNGQHYVIFLVLVTQSSDIGAYFVGRWLGKHKLAPKVSPGKTIEGFIGGIAFTLLVAACMHFFWNNIRNIFSIWEVLCLGLMFSLVGPIGDLAESWMKRSSGVKDSGKTFTGHGGMLDIIDSLLFTTIFYYIYLRLFHPGIV
jgi:phosphatidate cytidylyltransferase